MSSSTLALSMAFENDVDKIVYDAAGGTLRPDELTHRLATVAALHNVNMSDVSTLIQDRHERQNYGERMLSSMRLEMREVLHLV